MTAFTDAQGRSWQLELNVTTIKRVRALAGVDLLSIFTGSLLEQIYSDPVILCDILYAMVKPEADSRDVSDEDFGRALRGEAIDRGTASLLEEVANFSRSPKEQAILRAVLRKINQRIEAVQVLQMSRIESGELDALMDEALKKSGLSSGSAQESAELTPAQ